MHQIQFQTFDYNESKEKMYSECNSVAVADGDYHSSIAKFSYYDKQFNSEEEAIEFIEKIDKHWYQSIAVSYRHQYDFKPSKALSKLYERKAKAYNEYHTLYNAFHFANHKSSTVGCSNCGSKLSLAYLTTNTCPLCHFDLRPKTTQIKISKLKDNFDKLREECKAKEHEERAKSIKKAKLYWLCKYEYHV